MHIYIYICVCMCVCGLLLMLVVFVYGAVTPPAQRVQFLLGRDEEFDDEDHQAHAMFCEMEELRATGEDGEKEWKEVAR